MMFKRNMNGTPSGVIHKFLYPTDCMLYSAEMQNDKEVHETVWDPMRVFRCPPNHKYAVIVLNQPILLNKNLVLPMWKKAQITICVDRGAVQWMKYLDEIAEEIYHGESPEYKPTMVTGDFDSVSPDVIEKLQNVGVLTIKTPDQSHTDYSKAMMQLSCECERRNIHLDAVYTLVETAGRLDHIIGNINTLYKSHELLNNVMEVINVASNSLTWLLHPGKHLIKIPEILRRNHCWVGLVPFGTSTSHVTTTGLKWNLENTTMSFGVLVSTSNTYDGSPEVAVITDAKIIWMMGIEPLVEIKNNSH